MRRFEPSKLRIICLDGKGSDRSAVYSLNRGKAMGISLLYKQTQHTERGAVDDWVNENESKQ
jgi:hypothetical protein